MRIAAVAAVTVAVTVTVAVAVTGCGGAPRIAKVADLNRAPGELVDVDAGVVEGVVTIVDFRADWCGACDKIEAMVLADIEGEPGIVLRRVDVGEGQTPVARAYKVGALPHVRVFDRARRMRYVLVGNDTIRTVEVARSLLAEE